MARIPDLDPALVAALEGHADYYGTRAVLLAATEVALSRLTPAPPANCGCHDCEPSRDDMPTARVSPDDPTQFKGCIEVPAMPGPVPYGNDPGLYYDPETGEPYPAVTR